MSKGLKVYEYEKVAYSSEWFSRAACAGLNTSLFFPSTPRQHTDFEYFESHLICSGCPVMVECVATSVIRDDDQGFMGIPGLNRQKMDLNSDVKKSIDRAFVEFNNLEPQFARDGRLISRRCVSCYRRVNKIPVNGNDWGGRQSRCATCIVENKKAGVRQSTAAPIFNEWGSLISKVCSKCKVRKSGDEYSVREKGIGGLKSWCKSCMVTYEKSWRKKKKRTENLKTADEIVKKQKGLK
jgi:hypothetical protein